jgi:hypothetical protein
MTRIADARTICPGAFPARDWRWFAKVAGGLVLFVLFFWGLSVLGFTFARIARGLDRLGGVAAMMMPPSGGGLM